MDNRWIYELLQLFVIPVTILSIANNNQQQSTNNQQQSTTKQLDSLIKGHQR